MLLFLTGDIQEGKTCWLQALVSELNGMHVRVGGVIAPGDWHETPYGSLEKRGIDNVLLPQGDVLSFARRRDLAKREQTYDPHSQSARADLVWEIRDEAIARVNRHFEELANGAFAVDRRSPGLLVVDELGRLELWRGEGLVSAIDLLRRGPSGGFPHALVVVRHDLLGRAHALLDDAWGGSAEVHPNDVGREMVLSLFGA